MACYTPVFLTGDTLLRSRKLNMRADLEDRKDCSLPRENKYLMSNWGKEGTSFYSQWSEGYISINSPPDFQQENQVYKEERQRFALPLSLMENFDPMFCLLRTSPYVQVGLKALREQVTLFSPLPQISQFHFFPWVAAHRTGDRYGFEWLSNNCLLSS